MSIVRLFAAGAYEIDGRTIQTQHVDAQHRMERVRDCTDVATLREALESSSLQQGVRRAILARIKRLERAS